MEMTNYAFFCSLVLLTCVNSVEGGLYRRNIAVALLMILRKAETVQKNHLKIYFIKTCVSLFFMFSRIKMYFISNYGFFELSSESQIGEMVF